MNLLFFFQIVYQDYKKNSVKMFLHRENNQDIPGGLFELKN